MQRRIRRYAELSVARGCGFGALTVVTGMVGSANDLSLFFRTGGFGMLLMCFILLLKAMRVERVPVKSTEVWIMMSKEERPPEALAHALIARARRSALMRFAYFSAISSALALGADIGLAILRNS